MKTLLAVVVTFTLAPFALAERHRCRPRTRTSRTDPTNGTCSILASGRDGSASVIDLHPRRRLGGRRQETETRRDPSVAAKGISYAAINYRLTVTDPIPAPVYDAARAVQFLRTKAGAWNINKHRIALTGGSAAVDVDPAA